MKKRSKKQSPTINELKTTQELVGLCFSLIAESQHQGIKSEAVAKALKFLDGLYVETTKQLETLVPSVSDENTQTEVK